MDSGVIPCVRLYSSWTFRRRSVSASVTFMESVTLSAYRMTTPRTFRAARPAVWVSEVAERRYPSLSASRMATSETSGMSSPSRSRLIPIRQSNFPRRRSRISSTRSSVSMSEWR